MKLAVSGQMKRIDKAAIESFGIPSTLLMENAADGIVSVAKSVLKDLNNKLICVFCGSGNNGGDGACAARKLLSLGADVRVFLIGSRDKLSEDMLDMERRLNEYGGKFEDFNPDIDFSNCSLVIDALLGIGLNCPVTGKYAQAVDFINGLSVPVISADIASGLSADDGIVLGSAVKADITVTFSIPKPGLFLNEGKEYTGKLIVWNIGIPEDIIDRESFNTFVIDEEYIGSLFPKRKANTHKGNYGRCLLVCASEGYTGAAALAAGACLRSGAGLVSLGVPLCVYPILASKLTEAMPFPLPDDKGKLSLESKYEILSKMERADVLLIGPGLGRSMEIDNLIPSLLSASSIPCVVDADGLNALGTNIDVLQRVSVPLVLTPHDGEFVRLGGNIEQSRLESARKFAKKHKVILVLKGSATIVALPDGRTFVNSTGNPGMATGGSGDVLSGIITSFIGQGLSPADAACAAVWLHGKAGDKCSELFGQRGMLPTDMIKTLPFLLREFEK